MQRWSKNTARVRVGRMGVHPCCNSDLREDAIALTVVERHGCEASCGIVEQGTGSAAQQVRGRADTTPSRE
jgi:hypothetical protein